MASDPEKAHFSVSVVSATESGIDEQTDIMELARSGLPEDTVAGLVSSVAAPIADAVSSVITSSEFLDILHKPQPYISKNKPNKRRRALNQQRRELHAAFKKSFILPQILDVKIEKLD